MLSTIDVHRNLKKEKTERIYIENFGWRLFKVQYKFVEYSKERKYMSKATKFRILEDIEMKV